MLFIFCYSLWIYSCGITRHAGRRLSNIDLETACYILQRHQQRQTTVKVALLFLPFAWDLRPLIINVENHPHLNNHQTVLPSTFQNSDANHPLAHSVLSITTTFSGTAQTCHIGKSTRM